MISDYAKGDQVTWAWGKGTEVKRKASTEDPADLIEQSDCDLVLKLRSDLSPA